MSEYTKQANDFLKKHDLKFRATFKTYDVYFPSDKEARNIYLLTISGKGRGRYSTRFGQSINGTYKNEEPTPYDLLACMTKGDPGSFEDFCSEYGYDSDSRSAEKTYKAVAKDWEKIERFFTSEEIEELQQIS